MKRLFVVLILIISITSCGGNKRKEAIHERIDAYEDSIRQWGGGLGNKEEINTFADSYIATLLEAYEEQPDNAKTPVYLDRVHMWYTVKGEYANSIKWATQLLETYPTYENREMVLESVASMYDLHITPRDSTKVRACYEQLLKEFPRMDVTKKKSIVDRLKYNQLSFEEYIIKNIQNLEE